MKTHPHLLIPAALLVVGLGTFRVLLAEFLRQLGDGSSLLSILLVAALCLLVAADLLYRLRYRAVADDGMDKDSDCDEGRAMPSAEEFVDLAVCRGMSASRRSRRPI